ncbi:hypothetical protein GCM10020331_057680 [Ectobacillus funiculus]
MKDTMLHYTILCTSSICSKKNEEEAALPLLSVKDFFSISTLTQAGVFTSDYLVFFATDEDPQNLELALHAKYLGLEHIITKK